MRSKAVPADTTCFVIKTLTMGYPQSADVCDGTRKGLRNFGRPQKRSERVHAHGACVALGT